MTIYIDENYKCHSSDDGTMREIDEPFFDGKCPEFIEGYRYVPNGETWTRHDGKEFRGVMIAPLTDYNTLRTAQLEYELADADTAIAEMRGETWT